MESIEAILAGGKQYVATQVDRYRPMDAWLDVQETARRERVARRRAGGLSVRSAVEPSARMFYLVYSMIISCILTSDQHALVSG